MRSIRLPVRCWCLPDEVLGQHGNVFAPVSQGRDLDRNHVQTVEQILLELAIGDHLPQIAIRRGDHAHVDLLASFGAQRLELALLQHAQQLRLQHRAHRPDFIEQDRAAVCERELTLLVRASRR